jgi:hypothetical protein
VRVYAYECAHAQNASQRGRVRVRVRAERRAAQGGDLSSRYHSSHAYHYMYACAHVHMCACARIMHLSVRGRGRGRGRGRSGRPLIVCHFVHFISMYIYLYLNVGTYGCKLACLCTYLCA